MGRSAVRPDFLNNPLLAKRNEELDKKGISEDEKSLYALSESRGFQVFTGKKNEFLASLDAIQEKAMETASYEQIGQNALIVNQVKGLLNRLWSVVDDAKEACEGAGT